MKRLERVKWTPEQTRSWQHWCATVSEGHRDLPPLADEAPLPPPSWWHRLLVALGWRRY